MHLIFKAESNVPNLMSVKKPAENSRSEARKLCKSSLPFNVGFDSNFYNTKQHGLMINWISLADSLGWKRHTMGKLQSWMQFKQPIHMIIRLKISSEILTVSDTKQTLFL